MLNLFGRSRILLLCLVITQCYSSGIFIHPSCSDTNLVKNVVASVENMVRLGADSDTSPWKRALSNGFQTDIQKMLFHTQSNSDQTVRK